MRVASALLVMILLAGCAAPAEEPRANGPIDLEESVGTLLLDLDEGAVDLLTTKPGLAWMSPSGAIVTWVEDGFAVVLDRGTGVRDVAPSATWAGLHDDGSAVELLPGEARIRAVSTGESISNRSLPLAPDGGAWTGASADFGVLVAERARADAPSCQHDIAILAQRVERTVGCHAEVARDGRVAWTEGNGVRLREANGTVRWLAEAGLSDSPSVASYVAFENPVFTENGTLMLRLRGAEALEVTEVVDPTMQPLATLDAPYRLALLDASADGRWLLARVFV